MRTTSVFSGCRRRARRATIGSPEVLETRALLSNVSVAVRGNTLNVNGDARDNQVTIEQDFDEVTFTGLNGTTVNGEDQLVVRLDPDNPISRVNIRMRGGHDVLGVTSITQGDFPINASVYLGGGNDFLLADDVDLTSVRIFGGPGDDGIGIRNSGIHSLRVLSGSGNDTIGAESSDFGSVRISSSVGNDSVGMDDVLIGGNVVINTGPGHDGVGVLSSTVTGRAVIVTASGNDFVAVDDSLFEGGATALLGSGSDELFVAESDFKGRVFVSGGSGRDAIAEDDNLFDSEPRVLSFEQDGIDNLFDKLDELDGQFDIFD